ncbi:MAG: MarR family transcriptional regulator [Gallionella sp.]
MLSTTFLPLLRELADTYQTFQAYSAAHIRTLDLTPAQFDIVATLGDKGLVTRIDAAGDGRGYLIQLTKRGEKLFAKIFPEHLAHLQPVFAQLKNQDITALTAQLAQLRNAFSSQK